MNTNSLNTEAPIVDATFLNLNNEHVDTINITSTETALSSQETKALLDRSAIKVINITANEFKKLILEQKFSNDIHYIVEGSFTFDDRSIELIWNKPANLSTKKCCNLIGTKIMVLPDNLSVTGDFNLFSCNILHSLPINLSIGGNLYLNYCTNLRSLPENLYVGSDLNLTGCTNLKYLPKKLSVSGELNLAGCTNLKALPKNLSVSGKLNLTDCTNLKTLPENLSVGSLLNLTGCSNLKSLSKNLYVGSYFNLTGCINLRSLPENLSVGSSLNLTGCINLRSLPENLYVSYSLNLTGCSNLTALPENLSVCGYLNLTGCTNLTVLPENLSVGGHLNINNCTNLRSLPKNLSVGTYLNINNCTNLTALPENLSVGTYLDLTGCSNLRVLPENLSVGGDLSLTNCTRVTTLPSWITTLGLCSSGSIRKVYLENTGLSDDLIDRLRTVEAPGMHFYFSRRRAEKIDIQFLNLEQAFTFWSELASFTSEMPKINLGYNQAHDLIKFLERLTSTADYKNQTSQHLLAQRVVKFITTLLTTTDDKIRDNSLYLIHNALSSCDDRIILTLDDLETLQLLMNAEAMAIEKNDPSELRSLGLQMMRLEEVKRIAREHMQTLRWVDEIEVELAFQIEVRKHLDLPGATQNMLFRGCANVSGEDIAKAILQIKENCTQAKLESYLDNWAPWQKYQRIQSIPSFEELNLRMVKAIDDCIICAEKTNRMVALGDCHFDYEALRKAYLENGNNPLTNTPLDWSTVVSLKEL